MSNTDGIRPYYEFSHEASRYGGPEAYLDIIANTNRQLGIEEERGTEELKIALAAISAVAFWEFAKWGYGELKEYFHRKKIERLTSLQNQSEAAKSFIIINHKTISSGEGNV